MDYVHDSETMASSLEYYFPINRLLLGSDDGSSSTGPVVVLFVVCILFCFIWTPMICTRNCSYSHRSQDDNGQTLTEARTQAEMIHVALHNLNLLGWNGTFPGGGGDGSSGQSLWNPIRNMPLENRREFVSNLLVSRKILNVSKEGPPTDDGELLVDEEEEGDAPNLIPDATIGGITTTTRKTTLLLADVVDAESTSRFISVEPCSICLTDYVEGEVLCWSQNSQCQHCFHKECAIEWLLHHEECPLCRHNYLSLDGDDDDMEEGAAGGVGLPLPSSTTETPNAMGLYHNDHIAQSLWRSVQVLHIASRLQSLAETQPNTPIRLEGVELTNSLRGHLEIQRATDDGALTTIELGGRWSNIRVVAVSDEEAGVGNNNIVNATLEASNPSSNTNSSSIHQTRLVDHGTPEDGTPEAPTELNISVSLEQPAQQQA